MILAMRTDKPEAELHILENGEVVHAVTWHAHRELSDTLLRKIQDLLDDVGKTLTGLEAIFVYQGPGSFTGLRIGISVANTIAYSANIPVVGATGEEWIVECHEKLSSAEPSGVVVPEYGSEARITQPRK